MSEPSNFESAFANFREETSMHLQSKKAQVAFAACQTFADLEALCEILPSKSHNITHRDVAQKAYGIGILSAMQSTTSALEKSLDKPR